MMKPITYILLSAALLSAGCNFEPRTDTEADKAKVERQERENKANMEFQRYKFDEIVKLCREALQLLQPIKDCPLTSSSFESGYLYSGTGNSLGTYATTTGLSR